MVMEYFVIIGLILMAGYWIISPLRKPDQLNSTLPFGSIDSLDQLSTEKEGAYATIKELEFDFNMEKLSKKDYEELKQQYMLDAVACIKKIDELKTDRITNVSCSEKDILDEIEREVYKLRTKHPGNSDVNFCSNCGSKASSQDHFCFFCGTKLAES